MSDAAPLFLLPLDFYDAAFPKAKSLVRQSSPSGLPLGIAVHSQHLRQIAQQSALLGERQRLARDLHDWVTQALYGVTLFAQASRSAIHTGNLALTSQYIERLSKSARQAAALTLARFASDE